MRYNYQYTLYEEDGSKTQMVSHSFDKPLDAMNYARALADESGSIVNMSYIGGKWRAVPSALRAKGYK